MIRTPIGSDGDRTGVPRFAVIQDRGQYRGDSVHDSGYQDVNEAKKLGLSYNAFCFFLIVTKYIDDRQGILFFFSHQQSGVTFV